MVQDTIVQRLLDHADRRPDALALFEKRDGVWKSHSFRAYADLVKRAARAMIASGFEAGDTTCILGKNRLEWVVFDVATMAAGGAPAGIYVTSSPSEVAYIVGHAESKLVLVDALEPAGLATFIYTSGTTGPPKGVMLSHHNLAWTASSPAPRRSQAERLRVSYLPLSHIAEQMFTIHGRSRRRRERLLRRVDREGARQPQGGAAHRLLRRAAHLGEVPRRHRGQAATPRARRSSSSPGRRAWARASTALREPGKEPSGLLAAAVRSSPTSSSLDKLKPPRPRPRARFCVSRRRADRARRCSSSSRARYPRARGLRPERGHGPDDLQPPGRTKFGTVGPAKPGIEVKIADDGEILVRGPERVPRLLQGARGHGGDAHRRLAALRRPRRVRHRRLPHDHRPQEGDHHHRRRQEHRAQEHRGRAQEPPDRRRGRGDRRSPQVPHLRSSRSTRTPRRASPRSTARASRSCRRAPPCRERSRPRSTR
jgi:long-chain acyl-CoA synthetase